MANERGKSRRGVRAFKPAAEHTLESRFLLSQFVHKPFPGAINHGPFAFQNFHGGQAVRIAVPGHEAFNVSVYTFNNLTQAGGTVYAYSMKGGKVGLVIGGTTQDSVISIDSIPFPKRIGTAHQLGTDTSRQAHVLNIGSLMVTSGQAYQILGFHTVELSGPLTVNGLGTVDRIALDSIVPGGSIQVGGTLNTLNVAQSATFSGGANLNVGRDINWMTIGTDLNVNNGSQFNVARDIGLILQAGKGSDNGGQGGTIQGNLSIGPGSAFIIGRSIDNPLIIYGTVYGTSRISPGRNGNNLVSFGGFQP